MVLHPRAKTTHRYQTFYIYLRAQPPLKKLPTVFYIHGGPVAQDDYGFDMINQTLAAKRICCNPWITAAAQVVGWNFVKAIWSDWGKQRSDWYFGAARPCRDNRCIRPKQSCHYWRLELWRYPTNYTHCNWSTRFKAALSGAGSAITTITIWCWSIHHAVWKWNWLSLEKPRQVSQTFIHSLKADKIKTPTFIHDGRERF